MLIEEALTLVPLLLLFKSELVEAETCKEPWLAEVVVSTVVESELTATFVEERLLAAEDDAEAVVALVTGTLELEFILALFKIVEPLLVTKFETC